MHKHSLLLAVALLACGADVGAPLDAPAGDADGWSDAETAEGVAVPTADDVDDHLSGATELGATEQAQTATFLHECLPNIAACQAFGILGIQLGECACEVSELCTVTDPIGYFCQQPPPPPPPPPPRPECFANVAACQAFGLLEIFLGECFCQGSDRCPVTEPVRLVCDGPRRGD